MTKFTYNTKRRFLRTKSLMIFISCSLHDFKLETTASLFIFPAFEYGAVIDFSETWCSTANGCIGTGMSSLLFLACLRWERREHSGRLWSRILLEILVTQDVAGRRPVRRVQGQKAVE